MIHTAADKKSEALGMLARVLLVVFVVLLISGVCPWVWVALIATALVFAMELALVERQLSFGALGTAVRRHLRAYFVALTSGGRSGGGWDGGWDGGGDGGC